jgi:hypothetical protein
LAEPSDIVAALARRESRARRALLAGTVAFFLLLAGSYFSSRVTPSSWAPLLWTSNLFSFVISPGALAIGIANLSTSDKLALRILYGVATGVIVLVTLVVLAIKAYVAGGGEFH